MPPEHINSNFAARNLRKMPARKGRRMRKRPCPASAKRAAGPAHVCGRMCAGGPGTRASTPGIIDEGEKIIFQGAPAHPARPRALRPPRGRPSAAAGRIAEERLADYRPRRKSHCSLITSCCRSRGRRGFPREARRRRARKMFGHVRGGLAGRACFEERGEEAAARLEDRADM